jgi:casein kinase II subunit beta
MQVPFYDHALDMVLDNDPPHDVMLTDSQHEMLENAAELLYGLIHARYLVTARGLSAMLEKFKNCDFGRCPRVLCDGQPCLPVGLSDLPGTGTVKIFCPKCEDIYFPRIDYQCSIDGAYFGTTFPHLLLMTYPMYRPQLSTERYVPRVFGFKLHPSAFVARDGPGGGGSGGGPRSLPPVPPGAAAAAAAAAAAGAAATAGGPTTAAAVGGGARAAGSVRQQGSVQSMDQDEDTGEDRQAATTGARGATAPPAAGSSGSGQNPKAGGSQQAPLRPVSAPRGK